MARFSAAIALTVTAGCSPAAPDEPHVAPTGSGTACTAEQPCSLEAARDKVRTLNGDMQADLVVRLAGGSYALPAPLELRETATVHDSGTGGHDVIYRAETGQQPVLSGGTPITGWTLWDPARQIYRAAVPAGMAARQLYVGGVRAIRARGPQAPAGYRVDLAAGGFQGPDGSLASWQHPEDVEVVGWASWKSIRCSVAAIAPGAWHNVLAASTGAALDLGGGWFAADQLPGLGDGAVYQVGDFDGDGKADLLLAGPTPGDASGRWHNAVALSTGKAFAAPVDWLPDAGQGAAYHVGDFDGDGKADLLLAWQDAAGHWHNTVARSTGAAFTALTDWLPDAGQGAAYQVGDFDGDGRTDLLLAWQDAAGHWHNTVARSTGAAFAALTDWLPEAGRDAAYHVGDFDGDGRTDLLQAHAGADGRWHNEVARSTGAAFAAPTEWLADAGHGAAYLIGNFTGGAGDRSADVVFAGRDAAIAMQEPCWTDAHSQGDPLEYYNLNGVTWLENALELLDAPGEWYLDRSAGFAYYRPRDGEDLATAPVVAATLEGLIDGRGEVTAGGTRWLHNIRFEGLTFAYAGWLAPSSPAGYPEIQAGWHASLGNKADSIRTPGAVAFTAARAIGFERNAFTHLGAVGLDLATVQSCTVIGNAFRDISSTAIQLGEVSQAIRTATDPDAQTADNAIADNLIADAAAEYHGAVGIFVGYSRGTTIAHNDVGELPYTGISIGWGWGLAPDGTLTGCHDSFAGGIRLTGNAVHDVLRSLNDGGGIYTLGGAPDSVLEGNAISSVGHPGIGFASGIYHDQGTCYYTDRSNVVSGAPLWLAMWQPGTIVNNVIHDNYVDIDAANCWGIYGTSDHCNLGDPAGDHNTAFGNTATGGAWPAAAEAIRDQAGLEPAYRDLAAPGSGQRQDPR